MLGLGKLTPSLEGGNDFAFGGAQTGATAIEGYNPIDLPTQIAEYALSHPAPVRGALYTLDIGANDIMNALGEYAAGKISLAGVGTVVAEAETNTVHAVDALFLLGARNLLFYEVPNLGLIPEFEGTPLQGLASGLALSFDETVLADLGPLERFGLKVTDLNTRERSRATLRGIPCLQGRKQRIPRFFARPPKQAPKRRRIRRSCAKIPYAKEQGILRRIKEFKFPDRAKTGNLRANPYKLESGLFRKLQMIDDATTDQDSSAPPSNHFETLQPWPHSIRVNT